MTQLQPLPPGGQVAVFRRRNFIAFVLGLVLLTSGMVAGQTVSEVDPHSSGEYLVNYELWKIRSPFLDGVAKVIELVDGPLVVPWVLVALAVTLFVLRRRAMAVIGVVIPVVGWLPGHFAKKMFPRDRPPAELEPVVVYKDTMSFPSGHTGFATSITIFILFALTMWGLHRLWMAIVGTVWIFVVGLSRLYASAHYLLDVVGGAVLAGGTSLMLWPLAAWWWRRAQSSGGFWAEPGRAIMAGTGSALRPGPDSAIAARPARTITPAGTPKQLPPPADAD